MRFRSIFIVTIFVLLLCLVLPSASRAQDVLELPALRGDFLIRYRVVREQVIPKEIRESNIKNSVESLVHQEFYSRFKRLPNPGEAIPDDIAHTAAEEEGVLRSRLNSPKVAGIVTVSMRNGILLYQVLPASDANVGTEQYKEAMGLLGAQRLVYDTASDVSAIHDFGDFQYEVLPGFATRTLDLLPVLSSAVGELPFLRNMKQDGQGLFRAQVLFGGTGSNESPLYLDAILKVEKNDGADRITQIDAYSGGLLRGSDVFTAHRRFRDIELPSAFERRSFTLSSDGESVVLMYIYRFELEVLDEKPLDDSAFDWKKAPQKTKWVVDSTGKQPIAIEFDPTRDYDVQKKEAESRAASAHSGNTPGRAALLVVGCAFFSFGSWRFYRFITRR